MQEWKYKNDFDEEVTAPGNSNRREIFSFENPAVALEFKILKISDTNIKIYFESTIKNKLGGIIDDFEGNEITRKIMSNVDKEYERGMLNRNNNLLNQLCFIANNKKKYKMAISMIENAIPVPLPEDFKKQILSIADIEAIQDLAEMKNLKKLVDEYAISTALEKLKEIQKHDQYSEILLELAQYCEKTSHLHYAIDFYEILADLPDKKEYSAQMEEKLFQVREIILSAYNKKEISLQDFLHEKYVIQQCAYLLSKDCIPDNQRLIDEYFSQLCNFDANSPKISQVSTNRETVLKTGKLIRKLNEENQQLKKDLKSANLKLAHQPQRKPIIQNSAFFNKPSADLKSFSKPNIALPRRNSL